MTVTVDRLDGGEWAITAAIVFAGIGLAVGSQFVVVAATLPLWYVAATALGGRQQAMVRAQRTIGKRGEDNRVVQSGQPGETMTVRTTIQNIGEEPITDLRVVDGVPEALPVVDGTPRACVTLETLEETSLEYEIESRRGEHQFADPTIRTRDLTGSVAETWTAAVTGAEAIRCSLAVERVPLGGGTNEYAGEIPTDDGGSGIEFHSVREYEPGDPIGAIDWRRYAETRELSTVEYRAERATRIVCIVDGRENQFRAATLTDRPAAELSADAAEQTIETLIEAGQPTGVVGVTDIRSGSVPPGTDPTTRQQAKNLLTTIRQAGNLDGPFRLDWNGPSKSFDDIPETLPGEAQVYLFSSFVDDEVVELVERLRAYGHVVRVVSPDVTAGDDVATRLAALDRGTRLSQARAVGARVIDWELDRPLGLVLRDAIEAGGVR